MAASKDTLFSLEVVIEKLYVPYVTCRFPAVAFRLLDFPTILISHVEADLADRIRKKIEMDPYYHVPNQFADLQDKNGNFMMKKGKSCLFKIPLDTLATHLSNTPMYIMVIDEFPEVPKLLGNSSLPLDEVIDSIKIDINKNGNNVPSVHGDKGLFKVYSLMGKEIGYMILGFRLLSLGPGLIAHLPAKAVATRASVSKKQVEEKSFIEEIMEVRQQSSLQSGTKVTMKAKVTPKDRISKDQKLNETKEMGSMTDVEKCDALIQTVNLEEDKIHVVVSGKDEKDYRTTETQTDRKKRQKHRQKNIEALQFAAESDESDDGLLLKPNIFCPPPMYFNSEAEPKVKIEKDINNFVSYESTYDDLTLEDASEDELHPQKEPPKEYKKTITPSSQTMPNDKPVAMHNNQQNQISNLNLGQLNMNEPAFPLLTALLAELSKIQNPQFVSQAMNQVQQVSVVEQNRKQSQKKDQMSKVEATVQEITEVADKSAVSSRRKGRKSHKGCAHPSDGVPKQKGWIRKAPEVAVKKTKLVFGLTNTQRLRLAKQNPSWLKSAEQDVNIAKAQKQKPLPKAKEFDHELDTGNLSDTYTEVRRLAAAELEKSTMGLTDYQIEESPVRKTKKKVTKSRDDSPSKSKLFRPRSKSPPKSSKVNKESKKSKSKGNDYDYDADDDFALEPENQDTAAPDMKQGDKQESVADSVPSSRIEVHIPSARAYESDDNTFNDTFEDDLTSDRKSKFPGFSKGDETLPEPIVRDGTASMNTTGELDEDSPLESTRVSKQFKTMPRAGESLFKSTDDYDTKQFHSTDEPELQQLMSEDEKSETMITPADNRSARSPSPSVTGQGTGTNRLSMKFEVLNPKASQNSPLPATRRSQQIKVDSMNARPTPTDTPRSRSSQGSPKIPTPRQRKTLRERKLDFKKESIHTESVSSYMPSESENILSLISDGSYSDDFHMSSEKEGSSHMSTPDLPKLIPSTKLGFTIN